MRQCSMVTVNSAYPKSKWGLRQGQHLWRGNDVRLGETAYGTCCGGGSGITIAHRPRGAPPPSDRLSLVYLQELPVCP
jgi:hypothetical protein